MRLNDRRRPTVRSTRDGLRQYANDATKMVMAAGSPQRDVDLFGRIVTATAEPSRKHGRLGQRETLSDEQDQSRKATAVPIVA